MLLLKFFKFVILIALTATTTSAFHLIVSKHRLPIYSLRSRENYSLYPSSVKIVHRMSSKKENDTRLSRKKLFSPSAERNKVPIWDVISTILPSVAQNTGRGGEAEASFLEEKAEQQLRVLEIAAGCGVHTNHFMTEITNAQGEIKL
mmetsp:Transcript_45374/g.45799  ORF Transcript_45374/g.45799 Transcript_45374/m.45799 type:complete len:147 (-) Transcript_45374:899-1339(-)